jgi:AcrR family transcriptional regulator
MARVVPPDRFAAVVHAAARTFIAHGYQRTQVQDVADVLGLAKGTLYGYAQGKSALFAAAVRYADGVEPLPGLGDLPVPAPAGGEVAAVVAARLSGELADLELTRALARPDGGSAAELGDIVTDLCERLGRHRVAIKLVDRCAPELPELADVWFGAGRWVLVAAVEEYLRRGQATGTLALAGPAPIVARTVVELCALWAVHAHFDPSPAPPGAPSAAGSLDETTVTAALAAFVARATGPHSPGI